MSSFIVGGDMIDLLATVATEGGPHNRDLRVWHGGGVIVYTSGQDVADILAPANVAAVNYRYNETTSAPVHVFRRVSNIGGTGATWPDVLNACRCYSYQTCELPAWETSLARAIIDAIRDKVIDTLIPDSSPWEWTRDYQRDTLAAVRARITADMNGGK